MYKGFVGGEGKVKSRKGKGERRKEKGERRKKKEERRKKKGEPIFNFMTSWTSFSPCLACAAMSASRVLEN